MAVRLPVTARYLIAIITKFRSLFLIYHNNAFRHPSPPASTSVGKPTDTQVLPKHIKPSNKHYMFPLVTINEL